MLCTLSLVRNLVSVRIVWWTLRWVGVDEGLCFVVLREDCDGMSASADVGGVDCVVWLWS